MITFTYHFFTVKFCFFRLGYILFCRTNRYRYRYRYILQDRMHSYSLKIEESKAKTWLHFDSSANVDAMYWLYPVILVYKDFFRVVNSATSIFHIFPVLSTYLYFSPIDRSSMKKISRLFIY